MGPALDIRFHDDNQEVWWRQIKGAKRPPGGQLELGQLQDWIKHSNALRASIATLRSTLNDATTQNALKVAENASTLLDNALRKLYEVFPVIHRPNEQSAAKAREVFSIPELLENIMTCLPRQDILWSMIVCTVWRDCVEGSVQIQRILGIIPPTAPNHEVYIDYRTDGVDFPGFNVHKDGMQWNPKKFDHEREIWGTNAMENTIKVTAVFRPNLLRVGPRCRQVLIAYPIIKHAVLRFREGRAGWSDLEQEVNIETGITVGDLIDTGRAMIDEKYDYDHGRNMKSRLPEEWYDGLLIELSFKLTMNDGDEIMLDRREAQAEVIRRFKGKAYRRQKRIAKGDGDYDSDEKRMYDEDSLDDSDGPEYREIQAVERAERARQDADEARKEAKKKAHEQRAEESFERAGVPAEMLASVHRIEHARYLQRMKHFRRTLEWPTVSSDEESLSEQEWDSEEEPKSEHEDVALAKAYKSEYARYAMRMRKRRSRLGWPEEPPSEEEHMLEI